MIDVPTGRRAAWGIADQALSSATNFTVGILVARQTSLLAFGAFGLAFVTYLTVLNLGRSIVSQPLLIRHSNQTDEHWTDAAGRGIGVAVALGIVTGVLCVAAGLIAGGHLGAALIALGLGLPGLLLQDACRFAFFAAGRDRDAFLNDAVWLTVLIPVFAALVVLGSESVFEFVLGWGLAATAAGVVGMAQAGVRPQFQDLRAWFHEHADLIPSFAGETLARLGTTQLVYYFIGIISGIVVVGAIRGGELILGPFNVLFQGVNLIALPEASRLLKQSKRAMLRWCRLLSIAMAVSALAWGLLCLALPEPIGRSILGQSWDPARTVILPLGFALIGLVVSSGAIVGLRALGAADRILRATLLISIVTLATTSLGVLFGHAVGAAWGMVAGQWFGAVYSWLALRRALHVGDGSAAR